MIWPAELRTLIADSVAAWRSLTLDSLQFWRSDTARLGLTIFLVLSVILLVIRSSMKRRPGRHRLIVPALLPSFAAPRTAFLAHVPVVLFLIGVPFFFFSLADPFTALVSEEVTFPGRRIAVVIDASASGIKPFRSSLNTREDTNAVFYTNTAAAERFIRMREKGKYRDLIALLEFGNQAYVITPFTHDYDNILLSLSLIADPVEWYMFPDTGTIIAQALEQSVELFKAFDFLEASGNMMVLFTDGEDTTAIVHGKSLDEIVDTAVQNHIPLYFVRTNFEKDAGGIVSDKLWRAAVEKTGGKFFPARDEASLLQAIDEIDKVSAGTIRTKQYSQQQPRFDVFALIAAACWLAAAALKLGVPYFQKFP